MWQVLSGTVYYPPDAMLARVLAVIVCLSVCVSVCHTPVLYQNG